MQGVAFVQLVVLVYGLCSTDGGYVRKKLAAGPGIKSDIKTPVIIVPGSGGSQIQAKLNKPSVPSWYCTKTTTDYFTLWVKKASFLPLASKCWADNMRLVYDEQTNTVKNAPGVETRVPGFGNTDTIEHLDTDHLIKYFKPMVDTLVSRGYERGVSVRAAPYDFRYGPESATGYFVKLKQLIEETFTANDNKKITLMSHSLGCPYTMVFLNRQTQEWKDKYIHQWITLAGIWAGSAEIMSLFSSGFTLGVPHFIVDPLSVRDQQRTSTSNAMMIPSPEVWPADYVLVKTAKRTYTANDLEDFFNDIGFPLGMKLRNMVQDLVYPLSSHAPNVTLHCLYGTGVDTAASFVFGEGEFPDTQPEVTYGDGDGTVNRRSLEACGKWVQRQDYSVTLKEYPSVNHQGIIGLDDAHNYILELLF